MNMDKLRDDAANALRDLLAAVDDFSPREVASEFRNALRDGVVEAAAKSADWQADLEAEQLGRVCAEAINAEAIVRQLKQIRSRH